LTTLNLGRLWKNEYLQTAVMIVLIVMLVFVFWFGIRLASNTDYPVLAVSSGSMSTEQPDSAWSYPFELTLHTGDLIIVQGVKPQDIYAAPFNESGRSGDILVFNDPELGELIVHRAVGTVVVNGQTEFITEGDGNAELGMGPGPGSPTPPENIVGKVVLRIPWVGNLALFMRERSGLYLVLALIIIILAAELVLSILGEKEAETEKNETTSGTRET
jgi:signal peptidase I